MDEAGRAREIERLLFGVQRSVRYHDRREAFFARVSRVATWLSAVSSTAAIGAMVDESKIAGMVLAGFAASLSVASLVLGAGDMARKHLDLRRRFIALERQIARGATAATDAAVAEWTAQRLEIEEGEPPTLVTLNRICSNEQTRAQGWGYIFKIGWWRRWTASVLSGPDAPPRCVAYETVNPPALPPPA